MMGRLKSDQGQLFYEFHLGDAVPEDHLVRKVDAALDLSWLRGELAPHYSSIGRPSIDPELMIRMLIVGYVFAIRSERLICREVQVNLAYRWFCKLGIEDASRIIQRSREPATNASVKGMFFAGCSSRSSRRAFRRAWWGVKALRWMRV
jgi:transposase